jgi:DeoR family transcriptional regulator, suf operon transcriptional repressor
MSELRLERATLKARLVPHKGLRIRTNNLCFKLTIPSKKLRIRGVTPEQSPQLATQKGLRAAILLALKRTAPCSTRQLAQALGVSLNATRRHLKELETEGLVTYGREQRGLGAPTLAYRLSARGEALFPRRYEGALTLMLERVIAREGRQAAIELFEEHYHELIADFGTELAGADPCARLALVARLMTEAGYMAEWREAAGRFLLSEHNCAMRAVAERFPEVCLAEERFLREALGAQVERHSHIASGCNACEYTITFDPPSAPAEPV